MNQAKTVQTINVNEFKKIYDANPSLNLIDVRELSEWQELHIPRAAHISKDNLEKQIHNNVPDLNTPIYLHCRSGVRSLHAAHTLLQLGYTNVYSIDGGIIDWAASGYPTSSLDLLNNL